MTHRMNWFLKTIFVMAILVIANYPLAFAICRDISPHGSTLMVTILVISMLYGFSILCGPHHFHAVLIGLLAGNLISVLTWMGSFRDNWLHLTDHNKLSVYYCLGVFIPALYQFYLNMRDDKSDTKILHRILAILMIVSLLGYLTYKFFHMFYSDTAYFDIFHLLLGLVIGTISALIIHFTVTRNLLVFEKLSLYLKVMIKPIMAFFLGYILIMFTFTGLYMLAYYADPDIFSHLKTDTFGEIMFYSFSTITGLGFSILEPEKPITFFLTCVENFLGLVWMSVVFAAALAHLQLPFRRISLQLAQFMKEEEAVQQDKKEK